MFLLFELIAFSIFCIWFHYRSVIMVRELAHLAFIFLSLSHFAQHIVSFLRCSVNSICYRVNRIGFGCFCFIVFHFLLPTVAFFALLLLLLRYSFEINFFSSPNWHSVWNSAKRNGEKPPKKEQQHHFNGFGWMNCNGHWNKHQIMAVFTLIAEYNYIFAYNERRIGIYIHVYIYHVKCFWHRYKSWCATQSFYKMTDTRCE